MPGSSAPTPLSALLTSLNLSSEGIVLFEPVFDQDGALADLRVELVNDAAVRIFGIPREAAAGQLLSGLWKAEEGDPGMENISRVLSSGEALHYEWSTENLGERRWFNIVLRPFGESNIAALYHEITEQKRYLAELKEQALFYEELIRQSPNRISILRPLYDTEGTLLDFVCDYANYGPDIDDSHRNLSPYEASLVGENLTEALPSIKGSPVWDLCVRVLGTGIQETIEIHYAFDGKNTLATLSAQRLKDGRIYVSTIDTSEAQKMARELEREKQQLAGLLRAVPLGITVFESVRDQDGQLVDMRLLRRNEHVLPLSRIPEEIYQPGALLSELMPRELSANFEPMVNVVRTGEPMVHELYQPHLGKWISSRIMKHGDGLLSTIQDITEQKNQSAQMAEQAELFNSVLSSLQNGLVIYRIINNEAGEMADLELIEVSGSVERDTRRSRDQLIGQRLRTMYPGIDRTEYWKEHARVAATGEPAAFETHFKLAGVSNYLFNSVSLIGKDKIVTIYYIINDLKEAQRRLEHSVHELERSNADLEQFASIASHDLQEPLRKVQSFCNMLESRYGDVLGDDGRDLLSRMQSAATRMRNLVTGLLAFARLSGDGQEPLRPVDLNGLIADIITDLDQKSESARATITIQKRLPFVAGLESQLRQLFLNLITNALKFQKEGVDPVVTISQHELLPADSLKLPPLADKKEYVRIEIRDNGIGFDSQYSERIFGLFERLHGMSEYRGTGLGLSICRRVAERNSGAIWAESEPGKGSTFIVLLRRAD